MRWKIKARSADGWHRWFAWHPVKVDGQHIWLERIYRKRLRYDYGWDYDYRIEGAEIGAGPN